MTYTEKHIVETYSELFEGLSSNCKAELIENLSKSLKAEKKEKENELYASFGAFSSEKFAGELIADLKSSRKFIKREINF